MAHRPIGLILTAGFGTRLRPLTYLRPKPIMEIAGRPIIYFLIKMLEKAGVEDVFLNLHHQGEQIRKYLERTKFNARIHLAYEKEILGSAGGIRNMMERFDLKNRKLIIMHGDIICDYDLKTLLEHNNFCTLLCAKDREVAGYVGSVGVDRHKEIAVLGRFFTSTRDVHERGFFTGIHVLSKDAAAMVMQSSEASLVGEVFPRWLNAGHKIYGHMENFNYDDLGTAERLFSANMSILNGAQFSHHDILDGLVAHKEKGVFVGEGVRIASSAKIIAPAIISAHAHIGDDVVLGPNVVIGEGATILERARVSKSVIMARTAIEKDENVNCMIACSSARVLVKG